MSRSSILRVVSFLPPFLLCLVFFFTLAAPAAHAATLCVNPGGTNGCYATMAQAIANASDGDTIQIAAGVYNESGIVINKSVTLNGANALSTIVDATSNGRVFVVNASKTVTISNFTLRNGSADSGGAIKNSGALTLSNVIISANSASSLGGGIYNDGNLIISNSVFSGNHADSGYGGAIKSTLGNVTITNSTFAGNSAVLGGALWLLQGNVSLTNATLSGNGATTGGNIYVDAATVTVRNTIIANSTSGGNCHGTIVNGGGNLTYPASDTSCPGTAADPHLGALQDNGGSTLTMALGAGSAAINAAVAASCPATDQRGLNRRIGFCDVGAYEAQPASISVVSGTPQTTRINTAFALPLQSVVRDAYGNTLGGVVVNYAAPASGASAILAGTPATTNGSGNVSVTATANNLAGTYNVNATVSGVATPATFVLTNTYPAPTLIAIDPSSTVAGAPAFTLTLTGTNFVPASIVRWNGSDRTTTFVSDTQLRAAILAADVANVGTAYVTVFTPGPGGGTTISLPFVINKANTTTTITAHVPNPSVVGQSIVVNFTVVANAPSVGTPTGNVTVSDGVNSCTASVASGSCTMTLTTAGERTLTATYGGDTNYNGSSGTASHTVNKADTTTTITAHVPNPSVVGQSIVVNFTVVANAPSVGTPTGNVTVSDGEGHSCSATVAVGSCVLVLTSTGTKTLTATYAGNSNYNGSSATASHTVNKADTTTTITVKPNPSGVGQSATINFTVTVNSPGSGTPTGYVAIASDEGLICIATVTTGTCNWAFEFAGERTLIAVYSGDSNFNQSKGTATHTVTRAATVTTITAHAPNPSLVGQSVRINFTVVSNPPGSDMPTGNVTVSDGQGHTCTATVFDGYCNLTWTTLGVRTLTATYAGDENFSGSTSAGVTHAVVMRVFLPIIFK